jgi:hypothetical protein
MSGSNAEVMVPNAGFLCQQLSTIFPKGATMSVGLVSLSRHGWKIMAIKKVPAAAAAQFAVQSARLSTRLI